MKNTKFDMSLGMVQAQIYLHITRAFRAVLKTGRLFGTCTLTPTVVPMSQVLESLPLTHSQAEEDEEGFMHISEKSISEKKELASLEEDPDTLQSKLQLRDLCPSPDSHYPLAHKSSSESPTRRCIIDQNFGEHAAYETITLPFHPAPPTPSQLPPPLPTEWQWDADWKEYYILLPSEGPTTALYISRWREVPYGCGWDFICQADLPPESIPPPPAALDAWSWDDEWSEWFHELPGAGAGGEDVHLYAGRWNLVDGEWVHVDRRRGRGRGRAGIECW
ncbi:hypothetical protein EJ04DRAFT_554330 [Polyplosphaeria fusca]|uniref:Uncharacterized protein n=1 Tax=Polyplosphaeria fusca TaxID=682080 RepID=A0A9P4QT87_9PLEO|nr:hypothetical protein EJ04DRAFT_554330 [Polyplosphaeria fusca]